MLPFEGRIQIFQVLLGSLLTNNQVIPGTFVEFYSLYKTVTSII